MKKAKAFKSQTSTTYICCVCALRQIADTMNGSDMIDNVSNFVLSYKPVEMLARYQCANCGGALGYISAAMCAGRVMDFINDFLDALMKDGVQLHWKDHLGDLLDASEILSAMQYAGETDLPAFLKRIHRERWEAESPFEYQEDSLPDFNKMAQQIESEAKNEMSNM